MVVKKNRLSIVIIVIIINGIFDHHHYDHQRLIVLVDERGGLLRGRQRQRVAIVRALLKNAPILILDEATSVLDTISERLVRDIINRSMKDRTRLVILSAIQNAYQIALCSDGRITK
ncbi:ABC transporter B family member [Trifolium repens]|nr:ABC transporter B family member [Trifolium repens]